MRAICEIIIIYSCDFIFPICALEIEKYFLCSDFCLIFQMSTPSFKIVQTKEGNDKKLCIVPSAWENGGILKWPPINTTKTSSVGLARKMLNDINSVPGHDWLDIECSLKREKLLSKKVAEAELKSMMPDSDTSCNESDASKMPPPSDSNRPPRRQSATVSMKNADSDRNNFNSVVRFETNVYCACKF